MMNTNTCACNCQSVQQVQVPVTGLTLGLDTSNLTPKVADYSYEEHFTGAHWVDGKKIYRKVVKIEKFPTVGEQNVIPHYIKGVNETLSITGFRLTRANTANAASLNFPHSMNPTMLWAGSQENIVIKLTKDFSEDCYGYVFLEYTCVDR